MFTSNVLLWPALSIIAAKLLWRSVWTGRKLSRIASPIT